MARYGDLGTQYFDDAGDPLVNGKVYFYETGTTTLKATYADVDYTIANTNPVILTAAGRQPNIFFEGVAKAILATSAGTQILVRDPVGDTAESFGNPWISSKRYSSNDVVQGSDGQYYVSLINGNINLNPVTTTGNWTFLYSIEWSAGTTYKEGSVITYQTLLYQSLQSTNLNKNPVTETAYWVIINLAYVSTVTYTVGQNVVGPDGVFYTALRTTIGDTPASSPSDWVGTSVAAAASASAALASQVAAAASASTATTQASNASTSASTATTQAGLASTSASTATTQAGIATTQASNAAASAVAADASAVAAAASAASIGTTTGTGSLVRQTSPTLITPALGTPSAIVLTNASGTASININGTVGATTPGTGAFTTLSASGTVTTASISSATSLTLGAASTQEILFQYAGAEVGRFAASDRGIFTVGAQGSVGTLGTGYATIGAYGSAGGGFRIYRGSGAGTPVALFYGDGTGVFLSSASTAPISLDVNGSTVVSVATTGVAVTGVVTPEADNTRTLGTGALRWSTVYAGTGTINTSDAREKTPVVPLTAAEIAAAQELAGEIGTFQFLSSVAEKGAENARHHVGMTVQRAIEVMESHGLDPFGYAFICYDEWDTETREVVAEGGEFERPVTRQVTIETPVQYTEIEIIDGVPTQAEKTRTEQVPQFDQVPVVDADGHPVVVIDQPAMPEVRRIICDGLTELVQASSEATYKQLTHPVPVMETVTERYNVVTVREAGDRYGFRADQLALFILRGLVV